VRYSVSNCEKSSPPTTTSPAAVALAAAPFPPRSGLRQQRRHSGHIMMGRNESGSPGRWLSCAVLPSFAPLPGAKFDLHDAFFFTMPISMINPTKA